MPDERQDIDIKRSKLREDFEATFAGGTMLQSLHRIPSGLMKGTYSAWETNCAWRGYIACYENYMGSISPDD